MPTEHNAFMSYTAKANNQLENITWREFNHYDFLLEFKILYMDQREASVIKSTYCSCRGIEFSS